jgi:hypothetical protein
MTDLVIKLVNTLVSIVVGWFLNKYWYKFITRRPFFRVFGIPCNEKVFVVLPHRPFPIEEGLATARDRTHVTFEDMLAANYAERTLTLGGFSDKAISIRSVNQFRKDKVFLEQQHLILICSPKANEITKDALHIINEKYPDLNVDFTKITTNPDEWGIVFNKATLPSDSYRQVAEYLAQGKDPEEQRQDDYGLLLRANSPWNKNKSVFIIAGIRGIGTWGASRCLRERAEEIIKKTKGGNFALIVKVTYNNYKMVDTQLTNFFTTLQ